MRKVRIYGAGTGPDVYANRSVSFIIDPQNVVNIKKIHVQLHHQNGMPVNVSLVENGNETLTASYTAPQGGLYQVTCFTQKLKHL